MNVSSSMVFDCCLERSCSFLLQATDHRAPGCYGQSFREAGSILRSRVSLSIVLDTADQRAPFCCGQSFVRQVPSLCQENVSSSIVLDATDLRAPFCYGRSFVIQVPSWCQERLIGHCVHCRAQVRRLYMKTKRYSHLDLFLCRSLKPTSFHVPSTSVTFSCKHLSICGGSEQELIVRE